MIWLYRILYLPLLLIALPYYSFRMWRRGGYAKDFQHRFGFFYHLSPTKADKKRVWVQAVSVGELLAIGPLINALQSDKTVEIVLTTTTSTGYIEALKRYRENTACIGLFPLDFWPCVWMAWKCIQPDAVILTESELWPEHLHQAQKREIPAFLVNARISEKSFKGYKRFPILSKWLLQKFAFIFATSDLIEGRLLELGALSEKIKTTGNIKFDVSVGEQMDADERGALLNELGLAVKTGRKKPFVLLGSSTWPGEEQALLKVQSALIEDGVDCRLLLVPRHAERASEIIRFLEKQSLTWHQRSTEKQAPENTFVYLADTTGELARLTQIADLAFVGKSLPPNQGGQTPIEAAGLGIPILIGPNMGNFKEVVESLLASGSARAVENTDELETAAKELVNDIQARSAMSRAGTAWHKGNRGSSQRIADSILNQLKLD